MITYTTAIKKFDQQGEKTGWTYIDVPEEIAQQLKPDFKKSFCVKGKLDAFPIKQVAILPMGGGHFIMPLKADIRKAIGKRKGALLKVQLTEDKQAYELNKAFVECLADDPDADTHFRSLPLSHQNYYSKWIETAKTEATRTKRIAMAVTSLAQQMEFGEMLRSESKKNKER